MRPSTSFGMFVTSGLSLAHRLDIFAFGARDPGVIVDLLAPGLVGKAPLELPAVVFGDFGLKARERGTLERRGTCPSRRGLGSSPIIL